MDTFDLEKSTEQAWVEFQAKLADHLGEMGDDALLLLEVEGGEDQEGAAPYVQFCRWDDELRCEAVSNAYLAAVYALTPKDAVFLRELGFSFPTWEPGEEPDAGSSNFWLDAVVDDADRVAVTAVRALRHVYGVAHPALLAGHPFQPEPVAEIVSAPAAPSLLYPDGPADLDAFVEAVLTPRFGHPPARDDDGDIPIQVGTAVVYLRVHQEAAVVTLFAELVVDVRDERAARREVERLNAEHLDVKFALRGDCIRCSRDLDAWPLPASHLEARVTRMCELVDGLDQQVAAKVSGQVFNPQKEDVDDVPVQPPAASDEPGWARVDAARMRDLCRRDPAELLELVARARQERSMWASELRSAQRYDAPWAEACRARHQQAERRYRRLRHALRTVMTESTREVG